MVLCAAYGCNVYSGTGISMFKFPRDRQIRNLWLKKLPRGETATKKYRPSEHSKLCFRHFTTDQFECNLQVAASLGFTPKQLRLKKDAIPTIFDLEIGNESPESSGKKRRKVRASAETIGKKKMKLEIAASIAELRVRRLQVAASASTDTLKDHEVDRTAQSLLPVHVEVDSANDIECTNDTESAPIQSDHSYIDHAYTRAADDGHQTGPSTPLDSTSNNETAPNINDHLFIMDHAYTKAADDGHQTGLSLTEEDPSAPLYSTSFTETVQIISDQSVDPNELCVSREEIVFSQPPQDLNPHSNDSVHTRLIDVSHEEVLIEELTFLPQHEIPLPSPPSVIPQQQHKCATTGTRPEVFNIACQTAKCVEKRRSVALQAGDSAIPTMWDDPITKAPPMKVSDTSIKLPKMPTHDNANDSFTSHISDSQRSDDPDWVPEDDEDIEEELSDYESEDSVGSNIDKKYIVYESCLEELLGKCDKCAHPTKLTKTFSGTCVSYTSHCRECEWDKLWRSQPLTGTMPYGNLVFSAAIMFSAASPVKVINMMNFSNIQFFSQRTYFSTQSVYLVPAVIETWKTAQSEMIDELIREGRSLTLGGDARACSPGHTAKYGSYTMMNMDNAKVLDLQHVQSNEVKNSYAMELEGLKRSLHFLRQEKVTISDLITDRHSQIKKFMREEESTIQHWFDVWHVAKGVYKKLEAAGKKTGCSIVGEWSRSISNHMYWCAASSDGDGDEVKEKWLSILNHIADIHEGHGEKFVRCAHGPLEDRFRAWLQKGFKPYMEIEKVVKGRLLMTDIKKLSPGQQTSSVEAFHKVITFFAPKSVHFAHAQMEARLYLAALHFNENSQRQQAVTKTGDLKYTISYPKGRKGEGVAKEVKVKQTHGYVTDLMAQVLAQRQQFGSVRLGRQARDMESARPIPLCHSTPRRLTKAEIVENTRKRFNQCLFSMN